MNNKDLSEVHNDYGIGLINAGLMHPDELWVLGQGGEFDEILYHKVEFFQQYLDQYLQIHNAFFIIGAGREYNAWAYGSDSMNVIVIHAHVYIGNTLFYFNKKKEIQTILHKLKILSQFDNGMDADTIMWQTAEMMIFYHEVAHLVQMQEPQLFTEKISEDYSQKSDFKFLDHIAEIDADLYASLRIANHILTISNRDNFIETKNSKGIEDLMIVIISAYLLYRNIMLIGDSKFYTRQYSHPHLVVRMFSVVSVLVDAVLQNCTVDIDRGRILFNSFAIMDELCLIHPEIGWQSKFSELGKLHSSEITSYLSEIMDAVKTNPATTFSKFQFA